MVLVNNIIMRNSTNRKGGGIHFRESSNPIVINNTIILNFANYYGGGIYCMYSNPKLTNNILWADSVTLISHEIHIDSGLPTITYCNVQGGWEGQGNIDIAPLFRDPQNYDFHLQDSIECGDAHYSPCIDAGSPYIIDSLIDCSWGLGTERSDIGAYGGGDSLQTGIHEEMENVPVTFSLYQNYPNPFNSSTTIDYSLPTASDVGIEIFNVLGQLISTIVDERQTAGNKSITWNASDMASGIYFYKLAAGDKSFTKRCVLIK
jgi:parallel beta-helix repeat protein